METHRPDVPLIDRIKIQAEVLVPLIKTMEAELGTERAHGLVRQALSEHYRKMAEDMVSEQGSALGAMALFGAMSTAGDAVDVEYGEMSESAFDFDIVGCRYAQFFKEIGEPELGFLLVCSIDDHMAVGMPGLAFNRTQTIMQGADHCDFRYRILDAQQD
jgi:hypothetical protein